RGGGAAAGPARGVARAIRRAPPALRLRPGSTAFVREAPASRGARSPRSAPAAAGLRPAHRRVGSHRGEARRWPRVHVAQRHRTPPPRGGLPARAGSDGGTAPVAARALRVTGGTRRFGGRGDQFTVFEGLDLEVQEGEVFVLLGPS